MGERRAIEANAYSLDASVEDYDDVLVTLLGDVALAYAQYRTTEQRIKYATNNTNTQRKVLANTKAKFDVGKATKIDVKAHFTKPRPADNSTSRA